MPLTLIDAAVTLIGLALPPKVPLLPDQVSAFDPMSMVRIGEDVTMQVLLEDTVTSCVQMIVEPEMLHVLKGVPVRLAALPATKV